jgi:ABC-type transport system involved in multi-copper enzyme maturation permease subunit
MYFRTCWYIKRYRLIVFLSIAIALTFLGTIPDAFEYQSGHWVLPKMTPKLAAQIWDAGIDHTLVLLLVVMLFAAADLGALALGDDTKRRDLDFLITRPRPRRYFIWTAWLAGLTELVPLLIVPLLTSILSLFYMTHVMLIGLLLPHIVDLFAIAAAMYTLVFLLATLTGSAQNGFQFAALLVFFYAGYHYAQSQAWFLADYRPKYFGAFDWLESPQQFFPYAHLFLLACLTLTLPFIAQAGFSRRDL